MQGSQTLGKAKKPPKGPQRHSAGNIDYDNLGGMSRESSVEGPQPPASTGFRSRSKTVSDAVGKCMYCILLSLNYHIMLDLSYFSREVIH